MVQMFRTSYNPVGSSKSGLAILTAQTVCRRLEPTADHRLGRLESVTVDTIPRAVDVPILLLMMATLKLSVLSCAFIPKPCYFILRFIFISKAVFESKKHIKFCYCIFHFIFISVS